MRHQQLGPADRVGFSNGPPRAGKDPPLSANPFTHVLTQDIKPRGTPYPQGYPVTVLSTRRVHDRDIAAVQIGDMIYNIDARLVGPAPADYPRISGRAEFLARHVRRAVQALRVAAGNPGQPFGYEESLATFRRLADEMSTSEIEAFCRFAEMLRQMAGRYRYKYRPGRGDPLDQLLHSVFDHGGGCTVAFTA